MWDEGDAAGRPGGAAWRTITLVAMALLGAATLVALIWTLSTANRQRDRALDAQAHSYDVMILARTLAGTIARSEASLGRYVISADKPTGQLYFDEWLLAGDQLDRLEQLSHDNRRQQPALRALRAAYETRGRELSVTALSTRYGKNPQALSRFYQAGKAEALAQIDRALDRIIDNERALLDQRTAAAMHTVDRASRIAGVLAVFGFLLVLGAIVLGWLTVQALGERAAARADADAAEARAAELAAAVEQATDALRVQEARLRQVQKMEAVGQLTGGIAHDFNNMLAVVLGGLELARRTLATDPATAARHLDSATEGAARAAALTRRLLAFSREESLKPEPIAPPALVAGMAELLDRTLGDAITLVAHHDDAGWFLHADRVQLENVVLNLAVNARDAMDGRGLLTILTGTATLAADEVHDLAAGDYVTLAVIDTGCGMTPEVAERVFEPFFTTKPVGKGTGLGLSQIFGFARQLGGGVTLRTAPGEGTEVRLYLPRCAAPAGTAGEDVREAPAAPPAPAGLTILVVEDDPRVLAATMGAVEEIGHHGVACNDPLAAPAALDRLGGVDLIISDVLMPRQTGPEMVAALPDRYADLPVIFVTGFAGEIGAADLGRHRVLRKPYTLAGLERTIAEATGDREAPPETLAAE